VSARRVRLAALLSVLLCGIAPASTALAQNALDALTSWIQLDVATGYETRLVPTIAAGLPGWSMDDHGNLLRRVGEGTPRQLVACALDVPAYAVSQITEDGYLRVHRIGRGSRHPLWDQAFEAQQVRVLTRRGPVTGVVARANGHFAWQHRGETSIVTADDLWVDVGAASADEVASIGIELLDPIVRQLPAWSFADFVAGPGAGSRVGCAVVAALAGAAAENPPPGETTFLLGAAGELGSIGLASAVARAEPFVRITLMERGEETARNASVPASQLGRAGAVATARGISAVRRLAPAVRAPGSHMEAVSVREAETLYRAAAEAAGLEAAGEIHWVTAPPPRPPVAEFVDLDTANVASLLDDLTDLYAVSGHEASVRRYVLEALPGWARERAVVDDIGNVVVEAGPAGAATVFMAHMDEVGYEVASVEADGTVLLAAVGGAVASAWEGQTALLHFDPPGAPSLATGGGEDTGPEWKRRSLEADIPAPLRGVFLTRDDPETRHPAQLGAWFGVDGAALRALGVRPGLSVTSYKDGRRLGPERFVARGLDDRAGTTALLSAINAIDPERLPGRVIFAWSVAEENGLHGAGAIARRLGRSTRRIYSVDTFVSSDTPLESPHFAWTPLGEGPVLRAIESSGVSPDAERDRLREIAVAAGIPLQIGLTQGGTDGTWFTFWGAPNQGLSWPGRYSHSPGEVLDLRDLARLGELIAAVAMTGS
jgi:putative aminopeptidase FrvX